MRPIVLASLVFLAMNLAAREQEPSASFDLETLHKLIVPSAEEIAWQKIPWMVDLLAARDKASRQGKPIFLWEMDGHPLGCT